MTYIIKQDIAQLNQQIAQLQTFVKQNLSSNRGQKQPVDEHNNNVVMMLQSKLADTSMGFKDVLEIRTQVSFSSNMILAKKIGVPIVSPGLTWI